MANINSQLIYDNIGTGKENATSSKYLCNISGLSERDLRKTIEHLRRSGMVIISSNKGYYLPETLEEVRHYVNKERKRAKSIFYTLQSAKSLERDMINALNQTELSESEVQ